jgi:hypothetical protein
LSPSSDFTFTNTITADQFAEAQQNCGRGEEEAAAFNMDQRGSELDHFTQINVATQRMLIGVIALVNYTPLPYGNSFAPDELVELQGILRETKTRLKHNESSLADGAAVLLQGARDLKERV